MIEKSLTELKLKCYHCGDECSDESFSIDEKLFCCNGCKTVYEILNQHDLCNYYSLENNPGIVPRLELGKRFNYLDDPAVVSQLLDFRNEQLSKVTFTIPQMHCSSCIWLLENLFKFNPAINQSRVDYLKKKLSVSFQQDKISLKEVVKLLASIGYEPQIFLDSVQSKQDDSPNKRLYYRIGIAGFCFGNVMLFSFPEYLGIDFTETFFKSFFGYLSLFLSLPVVFYSAWEYFGSAIKGLRKKIINIDFPISLGILAIFLRSSSDVLTNSGAGYFDSLTGLVFFLLIGKLLQEKTYAAINFDRNYKSYFPLSVSTIVGSEEKSIPLSKLKIGDRIIVRRNEIIPADSVLFNGNADIDYSFVTGESEAVSKVAGEKIFAGGRQLGFAIELEVVKEVSQSYLTQLWNNDVFNRKSESYFTNFSNSLSKYFTFVILFIAGLSASYWLIEEPSVAVKVFSSVLIVACPCALALSVPFTLGNSMRIFGKNKFYLKNTASVEKLGKIDTIVFDKTGTITDPGKSDVNFSGEVLNQLQQKLIKSLVRNSSHPLSKKIFNSINGNDILPVTNYKEHHGKGISGIVYGHNITIGSHNFIRESFTDKPDELDGTRSTKVFISIDDKILGYFSFTNSYKKGIKETIKTLIDKYSISLLSGDNDSEKENLLEFFPEDSSLLFNQSPEEKLTYIKSLQQKRKKILMIGDGLNDAGALKQSDFGISVTDNLGNFSPACDAILESSRINLLPEFLKFSRISIKIIFISFAISFLYNVIGLSFAVQGLLSPIVAAILMPLSSISVVIFATVSTNYIAVRRGLLSRF